MSANYIPSNLPVDPSRDVNAVGFPQAWPAALGQATAEEPGIPWGRYVAALRRYKWLILAIALVGTGIGFATATDRRTPGRRHPITGRDVLGQHRRPGLSVRRPGDGHGVRPPTSMPFPPGCRASTQVTDPTNPRRADESAAKHCYGSSKQWLLSPQGR